MQIGKIPDACANKAQWHARVIDRVQSRIRWRRSRKRSQGKTKSLEKSVRVWVI